MGVFTAEDLTSLGGLFLDVGVCESLSQSRKLNFYRVFSTDGAPAKFPPCPELLKSPMKSSWVTSVRGFIWLKEH